MFAHACHAEGSFAIGLRDGAVVYFASAKLANAGWIHLAPGEAEAGRKRGIEGVGETSRGVDVRLSDVAWAAELD